MIRRPHWEIWAFNDRLDGTFLAVRYTVDSAVRCRDEFANRWPTVRMTLVAK